MSKFENYDAPGRSEAYDERRQPDSAEVFLAYIKHLTNRPVSQLDFMDAGCGTGNYGYYMLEEGAKHVTFSDGSERQLAVAEAKLEKTDAFKNRYRVVQSCLPKLPVEDASVDVIMYGQVLHHIDKSDRPKIMQEAFRSLRPGGIICISVATPTQQGIGYWAFRPWKTELERYAGRNPRTEEMVDMFRAEGFNFKAALSISHKAMTIDPGKDVVASVSDPSWRASDSFFSHVADENIARGIEMLKDQELVKKWREESDGLGVETAYIAQKPLGC